MSGEKITAHHLKGQADVGGSEGGRLACDFALLCFCNVYKNVGPPD